MATTKEKISLPMNVRALIAQSLVLSGFLAALPAAFSADHHLDRYYRDYSSEPLIVVDTKNCAGDVGLASFRAERVFKIQTGNCQDPDESDKMLYQVMLKSPIGGTDYEVIWVDQAGMQAIREQLRDNREAALRRRDPYRRTGPPVDEGQRED